MNKFRWGVIILIQCKEPPLIAFSEKQEHFPDICTHVIDIVGQEFFIATTKQPNSRAPGMFEFDKSLVALSVDHFPYNFDGCFAGAKTYEISKSLGARVHFRDFPLHH